MKLLTTKSMIAVTALTVVLAGCNPATPAAPDTREADTKAIRALETSWMQGFEEKNADKIVALYADDAVLMAPDSPPITGKAAIAAAVKDMLQDPNLVYSGNFADETMEISKSGELAYTRGVAKLTMTDPKSKKPVTTSGKYVTVYKKQADGQWRGVADIYNMNGAAK